MTLLARGIRSCKNNCMTTGLLAYNKMMLSMKVYCFLLKQNQFIRLTKPQLDEPFYEKTCLIPYGNNKGADQMVHLTGQMCSLKSAFIVHCLVTFGRFMKGMNGITYVHIVWWQCAHQLFHSYSS